MSDRLFGEDVIYQQRFLKSAQLYAGRIDGIWGPLTDAAYNAFLTQSDEIAAEVARFDRRTERNLASLQLPAQRAARRFMAAVTGDGIDARIISGTRSYEEQNALFRQGRFGNPGPRVTNARGGQSRHNFGIAWDIGIFEGGAYLGESPRYDRAAEVGLVERIEWGGHWTSFVDRPHYQLALPLSTTEIRVRFEAGEPYT
jgi:peptidoglycan L-alanyl-D-glutamate endopeptidase CwlK